MLRINPGCGQACPGIPKGVIKTLRSQKLKEVINLILCMQLHMCYNYKLFM